MRPGSSSRENVALSSRLVGDRVTEPSELRVQNSDQIRAGDQPQDGQGARAHGAARFARADEVISSRNVAFWLTSADLGVAQSGSASWGTSDLPLMLSAPFVTQSGPTAEILQVVISNIETEKDGGARLRDGLLTNAVVKRRGQKKGVNAARELAPK